MDKKLDNEVLEDVSRKYLETKEYIEQNLKEVCERENLAVREVFYFTAFVWLMVSGLLSYLLAVLFERVDK